MSKLLFKGDVLTSIPNDARLIDYNNSSSQLAGDTVQLAIDEVAGKVKPATTSEVGMVKPDGVTITITDDGTITASGVSSVAASTVTFNNSESGLTATNVQSAIVEVSNKVPQLETENINFNIWEA